MQRPGQPAADPAARGAALNIDAKLREEMQIELGPIPRRRHDRGEAMRGRTELRFSWPCIESTMERLLVGCGREVS
jgi:hypothetical protein